MGQALRLLPGIPAVESPFFEGVEADLDLSPDELRIARDLNRRGFAVLDFPDPVLDERIDRIRKNLGPRFEAANEPTSLPTEWPGRIQDAWKHDTDVQAIASNPNILALLTKLYGRRAFPFQTLNFPVGTEQAFHTDIVHFSSLPERFMCGVWLAMEDVLPGSGALRYIEGSHRWPIISNSMLGRRGWESSVTSAQDPHQDAFDKLISNAGTPEEVFHARKGQALIWTANLMHGGSPRTDPSLTRWSQVTHYYFDDCAYYTPALSDEPLGRLALRNITDASTGNPVANRYLGEEVKLPKPEQGSSKFFWGWRKLMKAVISK